jgi:hypothetical protein
VHKYLFEVYVNLPRLCDHVVLADQPRVLVERGEAWVRPETNRMSPNRTASV